MLLPNQLSHSLVLLAEAGSPTRTARSYYLLIQQVPVELLLLQQRMVSPQEV